MLTVKGAVGLVPKKVRNLLKSNHKLTEFYSRSLQRSGLFYGFPSEKKRMALYSAYLIQQEKSLSKLCKQPKSVSDFVVIILGNKQLDTSVESIIDSGINLPNIKVVTPHSKNAQYSCYTSIQLALDEIIDAKKVLFINSGDLVTTGTLQAFLANEHKNRLIYCDTDKIDSKRRRVSPHFMPDWNPELQLSTAYISTGVVVDVALLKAVSLTSLTISGVMVELWLKVPDLSIGHIPFTLVHRFNDKLQKQEELSDVSRIVDTLTKASSMYNQNLNVNQVNWPVLAEPLVSLVIPTKNARQLVKACIESILEKTIYQNYEILLVDNGSDEQESLHYFQELNNHPKIRVLKYPGEFNYSAINNFGVKHASGEIVGLINNDIEVIEAHWLTSMVGHAQREDIGCVGAKLLYSDGRIQHAGVVLGYGGGAGHAHKYFPRYHPGYMKRLVATQNYSAVTAACLLVKKSLFIEVGGLNDKDLTVAFNDVDFCLRVKELGLRNVFCAEAELYHHESVSRGLDHAPKKAARFNKELEYLKSNWCKYITHDPAYSPNLTLKRENFSIKTKDELVD